MVIDIRRDYRSDAEIQAETKTTQDEKDRMMQEFLAKGGKVEKLEPGIAIGASSGQTLSTETVPKSDLAIASSSRKGPRGGVKRNRMNWEDRFCACWLSFLLSMTFEGI